MKSICWLIALLTLILWGIARLLHPENMDFPHHFFLLKYAGDIMFVNFSVLMLLAPFLIQHGYITVDYYNDSDRNKVKSILVIYSIFLPGISLICISGILADMTPFYVIAASYSIYYFKNAYLYFSQK